MLKTAPTVFAVENMYQIMVPVTSPSLLWVQIGENNYYDESNGIMCSMSTLHRVTVPMDVLNQHRCYTVYERPLIERKPYFTETAEVEEHTFSFYPLPQSSIRAYHISDAHNDVEGPIKAAQAFGKFDMLILNGDILSDSGSPEAFENIYQICSALTGGTLPVVFSRGNHDLRGNYAEMFAAYTPSSGGNTYYTFRLGSLWGIILDCGEDKEDAHPAYGFTVCCSPFRKRQTGFLKDVIAKKEYESSDITTRVVISHIPFTNRAESPFDIEEDTYREWSALLSEYVRPHVMICGHTHETKVMPKGGVEDTYGQPCDVIVGGSPENGRFTGCGYIFGDNEIEVVFTDSLGMVSAPYSIAKG